MRARPSTAVIEQKREEAVRLEAEHAQAEATLEEQQSAACDDAAEARDAAAGSGAADGGAGRPGRAAARRRGGLPAHRPAARRSGAARAGDRAAACGGRGRAGTAHRARARSWRSAQQELTALRAEALALAQTIAAQAQALRQQLAEMETELKTARAALDQLREDRSGRSSEVAKLRSDLEHLEASCLAEVNVEAPVLRADAEIVRIADEELAAEEETCRDAATEDRADGPGEHDGARRVQGNGGAAQLP